MYKERLKKNYDLIFLIITGLVSVGTGLASIFFRGTITEGVILLTIGFICISITIERLIKLENIEKSLNELKEWIRTIAPAEVIDGRDEIYKSALEIINEVESTIRATSFGKKEHIPDWYLEEVANKLKEKKEEGKPVEYRVVMSPHKRSRRSEIFEKEGVSDYLRRRYINTTWGLDVLIVDNKHLLIAFPEVGADESVRKGILFKNKVELVRSIKEWYDAYLWEGSRKK